MPTRRVFLSLSYEDRQQARGVDLMPKNPNADVDFSGRHLLNPVDSTDESYIKRQVKEQMHGTSVTAVLLGNDTHNSEWVKWEIEKSIERGNGILAIRLKDQDALLPPDSPVREALGEAGAEIIDWEPDEMNDAIERAFQQARRAEKIRSRSYSTTSSCAR
ncbi:TIR domain-containing protein [Salinibacter altiplanensis]|uniref:TIR domain-containing protein n=1 Tax=Salinibacter altiplanensis TaxID=1803181 RepID=UPI000C9FDEED|nr:TIR domain-containing protein [Salinibacter altiplanensis]